MDWVVLVYRVPREPSAPRIAIWRRLRALGVGQLADGVVTLPDDARTREQLEWVADRVVSAGGSALLLRAQTLSRADEQTIARAMSRARGEEYAALGARVDALAARAGAGAGARGVPARTVTQVRKELREIQRRDHFPPPERATAVAAVDALVAATRARAGADRLQDVQVGGRA